MSQGEDNAVFFITRALLTLFLEQGQRVN